MPEGGLSFQGRKATLSSRRDQAETREVGPISPGVAGEEGQALDQDVGPDEEVRERRGPLAAALPVGREGAGRRPSGAVRECQPPYAGFGKGLLEQRFSFEPEAQLR